MTHLSSWDNQCLGARRRLLERPVGECHNRGDRERLCAGLAEVMAEIGKRLSYADGSERSKLRGVNDGG